MRLVSDDYWAIATIWMEARGEIYDGKVAVGEVIRTRTREKFFSDGLVPDTVLRPLQFSCWNPYSPMRAQAAMLDNSDPVVADCEKAWQASESSSLAGNANHYYNANVTHPDWAAAATSSIKIGNHTFVRIG